MSKDTVRKVALKADDQFYGPKNRGDGPAWIDGELGLVCMYFLKRTSWVAMTPMYARSLAHALIRQANEIEPCTSGGGDEHRKDMDALAPQEQGGG